MKVVTLCPELTPTIVARSPPAKKRARRIAPQPARARDLVPRAGSRQPCERPSYTRRCRSAAARIVNFQLLPVEGSAWQPPTPPDIYDTIRSHR